jgi:hypothetical protein
LIGDIAKLLVFLEHRTAAEDVAPQTKSADGAPTLSEQI